MKRPSYEASAADKRQDRGMREGSAADKRADAKAKRKPVPQRDGLRKFAASIKAI